MKVQIGWVVEFFNLNLHSVVLTIVTGIILLFPLLKFVKSKLIFSSRKDNQLFITENIFPVEMETLRYAKKLAALKQENCEEHPRSNLAHNSNVPRSQKDYITEVSEKIEGRVTKKLSEEFNRTENRKSSALARVGELLINPLIQRYLGTTPETSWNAFSTSQGTNGNDSQSDAHPEAGILHNQTAQISGPEETPPTW